MKRALAALVGTGLLLASCGQQSPPTAGATPAAAYGDGLDHSWTATAAEGQGVYGALSSGLKAQDFNVGLLITATSGWGPIEVNASNGETAAGDGQPLTLNGKVYPTGLGVHANSEIHVHAIGLETPACTRFQADVGIDDEVGERGSVVFQVYANGEKLYDSGVMTGASATQHIDVPIGNKNDLRFVVTNGGDNIDYDHADWAGATLTCAPQTAPSVTLDSNSLNIYHLHTGTLHATFHNYPAGTYQIALVPNPQPLPPSSGGSTPPPYPLQLQTTEVTLTGTPAEARDIVIGAPTAGTFVNAPDFQLTTARNGTVLSNLPVKLTELPIQFTARFEPSTLSGRDGETKTAVLVVTANPPLDGPRALDISGGLPPELQPYNSPTFLVGTMGSVSGNGIEMRQTVSVTFVGKGRRIEDLPFTDQARIGVAVGTITTGYRDPFYGPDPTANLTLTLTP